jgi:hypothetical protein
MELRMVKNLMNDIKRPKSYIKNAFGLYPFFSTACPPARWSKNRAIHLSIPIKDKYRESFLKEVSFTLL